MTVTVKNKTERPNCNVEAKLAGRSRILEEYSITELENEYSLVKEIFL
jgi:hypothetical protein